MLSCATISKSRTIKNTAILIGGVWIVSSFVHNFWTSTNYFLYSVLADVFLAYQFRRLARSDMFPAPLYVLMVAEIAFTLLALATSFSIYWTYFVLNRVLDLMLFYVIGCSLFRIRVLKSADEKRKPPSGWRAQFAAI